MQTIFVLGILTVQLIFSSECGQEQINTCIAPYNQTLTSEFGNEIIELQTICFATADYIDCLQEMLTTGCQITQVDMSDLTLFINDQCADLACPIEFGPLAECISAYNTSDSSFPDLENTDSILTGTCLATTQFLACVQDINTCVLGDTDILAEIDQQCEIFEACMPSIEDAMACAETFIDAFATIQDVEETCTAAVTMVGCVRNAASTDCDMESYQEMQTMFSDSCNTFSGWCNMDIQDFQDCLDIMPEDGDLGDRANCDSFTAFVQCMEEVNGMTECHPDWFPLSLSHARQAMNELCILIDAEPLPILIQPGMIDLQCNVGSSFYDECLADPFCDDDFFSILRIGCDINDCVSVEDMEVCNTQARAEYETGNFAVPETEWIAIYHHNKACASHGESSSWSFQYEWQCADWCREQEEEADENCIATEFIPSTMQGGYGECKLCSEVGNDATVYDDGRQIRERFFWIVEENVGCATSVDSGHTDWGNSMCMETCWNTLGTNCKAVVYLEHHGEDWSSECYYCSDGTPTGSYNDDRKLFTPSTVEEITVEPFAQIEGYCSLYANYLTCFKNAASTACKEDGDFLYEAELFLNNVCEVVGCFDGVTNITPCSDALTTFFENNIEEIPFSTICTELETQYQCFETQCALEQNTWINNIQYILDRFCSKLSTCDLSVNDFGACTNSTFIEYIDETQPENCQDILAYIDCFSNIEGMDQCDTSAIPFHFDSVYTIMETYCMVTVSTHIPFLTEGATVNMICDAANIWDEECTTDPNCGATIPLIADIVEQCVDIQSCLTPTDMDTCNTNLITGLESYKDLTEDGWAALDAYHIAEDYCDAYSTYLGCFRSQGACNDEGFLMDIDMLVQDTCEAIDTCEDNREAFEQCFGSFFEGINEEGELEQYGTLVTRQCNGLWTMTNCLHTKCGITDDTYVRQLTEEMWTETCAFLNAAENLVLNPFGGETIDECTADVPSVRRGIMDLGVDCPTIIQYNLDWFSTLPQQTCQIESFYLQCCITCEQYLYEPATASPDQENMVYVEVVQGYSGITNCALAVEPIRRANAAFFNLHKSSVAVTPGDGCEESLRRALSESDVKYFDVTLALATQEEANDVVIAFADSTFEDDMQVYLAVEIANIIKEEKEKEDGGNAVVYRDMGNTIGIEEVSEAVTVERGFMCTIDSDCGDGYCYDEGYRSEDIYNGLLYCDQDLINCCKNQDHYSKDSTNCPGNCGLSWGVIAGIIIGVIVVVAGMLFIAYKFFYNVFACIFCCCCKKSKPLADNNVEPGQIEVKEGQRTF